MSGSAPEYGPEGAGGVAAPGRLARLTRLHGDLLACRRCPAMHGPPVHGRAVLSPVMMIGQAPGTREIQQGIPFCWTAGKTLFRWFESIGVDEPTVRRRVLMSAVCRCFPGKQPKGGDRVPDAGEVMRCSGWWQGEMALARPRLILPVGRLAIEQLMPFKRLDQVVGARWDYAAPTGEIVDLIPLPHPSGASTWFKMTPGKGLLEAALALIDAHPAWQEVRLGTGFETPGP